MEVRDRPQTLAAFPQGKERLYLFNRRLGWPQSRSGRFAKHINHLHLPALFSYCTDYVTPAAGNKRIVIEKWNAHQATNQVSSPLDLGTHAVQFKLRYRPCRVHSSDATWLYVKHCANKAVQFRSQRLYSVLLGCQERKLCHAQNHGWKGQVGSDLEIVEAMKWTTSKADPSRRSVLDAEIS